VKQSVSLITLGVADYKRSNAFYAALGWTPALEIENTAFFQANGVVLGRLWPDTLDSRDDAAVGRLLHAWMLQLGRAGWGRALERESEHPLAEAIVNAAHVRGLDDAEPATQFEAVAGEGALATVAGRRLAVGNARLLKREDVALVLWGREKLAADSGIADDGARWSGISGRDPPMSPSTSLPAEPSTADCSCLSMSPRCLRVRRAHSPLPELALLSEPRTVRADDGLRQLSRRASTGVLPVKARRSIPQRPPPASPSERVPLLGRRLE
jgi:catechol 2,3-dioxygenase-like lactoylglutathione lyase family enzyme